MDSIFPPLLIRASAGTGKTYQLTNRYLRLLFAGESSERILATTFTRKAAQEIYVRVIQRLARAAQSEQGAAVLADDLKMPACTTQEAKEVLARLVQEQHRLRILTLDSFCIQLARSFPTELRMSPAWSLLHEDRAKGLRIEAIRRVCSQGSAHELSALVQLLSQGDFGRSIHDKLERDIMSLYELFRESSDDAWSWLSVPEALSPGKLVKAIEEMRTLELPVTKAGEPNKNYVKAHAQALAALEAREWEDVIKKGIGKAIARGETKFSRSDIPDEVIHAYQALLPHIRHVLLSKLREQTLASLELLHRFEEQYEGEKKRVGAYSFSDVKHILAQSAFLGEIDEIFFRLDSSLSHILFDEFQDTSRSEWQVLEPLVAETLSHATEEKSFFCVGDVKQAIYGWRGGVSEIFDTLQERWQHLKDDPMTKSYRSSPVVLDLVNKVFSYVTSDEGLGEHKEVAHKWKVMFQEHSSAKEHLRGYVELRKIESELDSTNDVFQAAIDQIQSLHEANPNMSIGVLVRRNKHVARLIFELRRREIPASEEGGNPLTDSQGVSLILSLLRWIDHPGDTRSLYHVAHSPLGSVVGLSYPLSQERAQERNAFLRGELANLGYDGVIHKWAHGLAPEVSSREARRLYQLVELAHAFDAPLSHRTRAFVDYIEHTKVDDPEQVAVRVMTVHQSKGLEFDAVILPELDKSLL
ncbi:MAG: UvrD-helicase domain-containing protein, partial [Bdellovibrionales bacterium]|nr:UvrD-helicase domain-containing protein [Bdellovibrionales bacterium]